VKIITPAITEPITLAMARKQCKVDAEGSPPTHEDDDLIELFLSAAREWCEAYLGLIVAPSLVESAFDEFPADATRISSAGIATTEGGTLTLETGPVLGIESIAYVDPDGNDMLVDSSTYTLDTTGQVAVIRLVSGEAWPDTGFVANAVHVRYVVGYSAPGDSPQDAPLPKSIQVAILLVLGHLYANRTETVERSLSTIPMGACAFLSPLKVRKGFA
jgi:uncharacterized phiE125 gp8 family phage protein